MIGAPSITILEPPVEAAAETSAEETEGPQEIPSVFSVVYRYLVGAANVSDPAEDGSRVVRLQSATGNAIIEADLSPQLCEFLSSKLVEVPIIEEGQDDATPEE